MKSPKKLLSAMNLRPKRWLAQNFLIGSDTAKMIVNGAKIGPEDVILEIGAGLGALTFPLARAARKVYAVEKDRSLIPILESEIAARHLTNVVLIDKSILAVDFFELAIEEGEKITVAGNLPYNVSSQVLIKLIQSRETVYRAVLMFQKEFADRITARAGNRDYGRITVMLNYFADIRSIAVLRASHFYPKPSVDSQLIEIFFKPVLEDPAIEEAILFSVIKAAFSKRRKTLKNALSGSTLFDDSSQAKRLLESAGIDPIRRAETLTVKEFVKLSNMVSMQSTAEEKNAKAE
jgi:16S rRNA (adenine1518-N6/adenine1519-N6)-dimethyltransferase